MKHSLQLLILSFLAAISMTLSAQINTDQVIRIGQNALYFEDYMLSIQYFNRVIQAKPYLARPYFLRAIAKLNLDDYHGAEIDASKAIELNPFIADAYEVRGVARQNMGKTEEAIADYDAALSQLPENRNIMFNKALAQESIGQLDSAKVTLDQIIASHPGYENAYIGRAKVELSLGDTINASADLDKAISINKNAANAYVMRANIAISGAHDYAAALADMNEAIKLQPQFAGYFINRAFLRYNLDDYYGAMADYNYAITLDPINPVAYFNRGILRAQVYDNDKAIEDFSQVLKIDPNDYRSLYNRALIYKQTNNYRKALEDINRVIELVPEASAPMFIRFEIYYEMGDNKNAALDYDHALALSKSEVSAIKESDDISSVPPDFSQNNVPEAENSGTQKASDNKSTVTETAPEDLFANRFTTLLTIDNEVSEEQEYNNKNIRGKVQDRNVVIGIEPSFVLSYYSAPTELAPSTYFMQEIDRINSTRQLRFLLQLTNIVPALDDEQEIGRHFQSIEYYNSYLSTHEPRAIDYFGRAMDHFTLKNYDEAASDLNRAIEIAPDFTLAYFLRAIVNTNKIKSNAEPTLGPESRRSLIQDIIADYDRVSELAPRSPFPHFNKGNLYTEMQDMTSALSAYSKAIELKHDFGEAYYNRGYVYFKLGNKDAGSDDLSRAGQLGIAPSYNLMKRMGM